MFYPPAVKDLILFVERPFANSKEWRLWYRFSKLQRTSDLIFPVVAFKSKADFKRALGAGQLDTYRKPHNCVLCNSQVLYPRSHSAAGTNGRICHGCDSRFVRQVAHNRTDLPSREFLKNEMKYLESCSVEIKLEKTGAVYSSPIKLTAGGRIKQTV